MTVWHGSSCKVLTNHADGIRLMAGHRRGYDFWANAKHSVKNRKHPQSGCDNTDFGRGFYVTPLYEQAKSWAARFKRRGEAGVVSRYTFDEVAARGLNVLQFTLYSDEWLSFVLTCRSGRDDSCYDIVSGGVANDRVFNTRVSLAKLVAIREANRVELYMDGLIDKTEALRRLQYEKPNMQLCLRTAGALGLLQFEGSETL